jgi:hypothetical protein
MMNRIIWKTIGALILFCFFALVFFTIKVHDTLESRNKIELGYVEALHVMASRNYDSKEELALKNQLKQKTSQYIQVFYDPRQQAIASYAMEVLDKARSKNIHLIGEYPTPPLDLILFQDSKQFYRYAQIRNTNGYYSDLDKIIGILPHDTHASRSRNTQKELIHYIVMHEYSHYALIQKIQALGIRASIPEWFLEGYAEYISFTHSEDVLRSIPPDTVIPFENLEKPQQWKHLRTAGATDIYRQSEEAISYIINQYGSESIINILMQAVRSKSFEDALRQSTGLNYDELEEALAAL